MRESYFQLMLLNPTPGISTYFNIKWKQKSSTIHRTNEDHQKEKKTEMRNSHNPGERLQERNWGNT